MFGEILKKRILEQYHTCKEFADKCGIKKTSLSGIINGQKLPRNDRFNLFLKNLTLTEEEEKELTKEWVFGRSKNKLRKDYEKLEKQNKNMLEVLSNVKHERELMQELEEKQAYESFYNAFFKNLDIDETRSVLVAILRELKLLSLEKGNTEKFKTKFEQLQALIDKIDESKSIEVIDNFKKIKKEMI